MQNIHIDDVKNVMTCCTLNENVQVLMKELLSTSLKKENNIDDENSSDSKELTSGELIRLQQLIMINNQQQQQQQQQESEEEKNVKQLNTVTTVQPFTHTTRPHMENDIDPLWYLVEGPLIIFPTEKLNSLTIEDLVEYYRAYPTLNWTKYPILYNEIINRLTTRERNDLKQMNTLYNEQQRMKRRNYRLYHNTIRKFSFYSLINWLWRVIKSYWSGNIPDTEEELINSERTDQTNNETLFSVVFTLAKLKVLQWLVLIGDTLY
jgi:hypothetical protein